MATGEHVRLKHALALVLGQLLDDLALAGEELVVCLVLVKAALPLLARHVVGGLQAVRSGLIRPEDTEVVEVLREHVGRIGTEDARRLGLPPAVAVLGDRHLMRVDVWQRELSAHRATVSVGVRAQAQVAFRHERGHLGTDLAAWA